MPFVCLHCDFSEISEGKGVNVCLAVFTLVVLIKSVNLSSSFFSFKIRCYDLIKIRELRKTLWKALKWTKRLLRFFKRKLGIVWVCDSVPPPRLSLSLSFSVTCQILIVTRMTGPQKCTCPWRLSRSLPSWYWPVLHLLGKFMPVFPSAQISVCSLHSSVKSCNMVLCPH